MPETPNFPRRIRKPLGRLRGWREAYLGRGGLSGEDQESVRLALRGRSVDPTAAPGPHILRGLSTPGCSQLCLTRGCTAGGPKARSVGRGALDVVNDQHLDRRFFGCEIEAQLLAERLKQVGRAAV